MLDALGVNLTEIIFAFVNFLLLVFILFKLLYKPTIAMFEQRRQTIQAALDDAAEAKEMARQQKEDYEKQIANAYNEAQDIINDAKNKATVQADEIINEAARKAEEMKAQAAIHIEKEKAAALNELKTQIADLASMAAAQIMEREVASSDNDAIVNNIIESAGKNGWRS
ncbi:MAG: F0F1 ATP synthase subunit B [Clostridiales bacterium]|nr:F0F1 ATP synthase subunit B [Candidatus Crickella equi]